MLTVDSVETFNVSHDVVRSMLFVDVSIGVASPAMTSDPSEISSVEPHFALKTYNKQNSIEEKYFIVSKLSKMIQLSHLPVRSHSRL